MIRVLLAALVALIVLPLAACTGTDAEKAAKRQQLVMLAVDRIERFNALGVDPLQLEPVQLLALDSACVLVLAAGTEVGIEDDTLLAVSSACDVIMKAAAPASAPTVSPVPEAKPAA